MTRSAFLMLVTTLASFVMLAIGIVGGAGCNSIVGNEVGYLRALPAEEEDEAGALPETDAAPPPEPKIVCKLDEKVCFGTCVPNLSSGFGCASPTSCDPCPQPDHAVPACNGAVCGSTCKDGYDNCDTSNPDCETDLSRAATCGKCNAKCPDIEPFCVPSGATFRCMSTCRVGTVSCNTPNQCFDLQINPSHCGVCNKVCPQPANSTASCAGGACKFECNPGFHNCGGTCVLDTDINACGASCTACVAHANMNVACEKGACASTCKAGWADCDGNLNNGCEVNTTHDPANCGTCGNACGGIRGDDLKIGPIARRSCCVNSVCTTKLCAL